MEVQAVEGSLEVQMVEVEVQTVDGVALHELGGTKVSASDFAPGSFTIR